MNDTRVRHLFPGVRVLAPAAFYRLFGPAEDLGATIHVFLDRIPLREENENGTRALIVGANVTGMIENANQEKSVRRENKDSQRLASRVTSAHPSTIPASARAHRVHIVSEHKFYNLVLC